MVHFKTSKTAAFAVALAALASPAFAGWATSRAEAAELPQIGQWVKLNDAGSWGCASDADYDRWARLAREQDRAAFGRFALEHCTFFKETEAIVEDISVWHGRGCVRPRGATECLWVPIGEITPPTGAAASADACAKDINSTECK